VSVLKELFIWFVATSSAAFHSLCKVILSSNSIPKVPMESASSALRQHLLGSHQLAVFTNPHHLSGSPANIFNPSDSRDPHPDRVNASPLPRPPLKNHSVARNEQLLQLQSNNTIKYCCNNQQSPFPPLVDPGVVGSLNGKMYFLRQ